MMTAVILAAGKGTRMKSSLPKVLHKIAGKTMLERAADAAKKAADRLVFVVGCRAVKTAAEKYKGAETVTQRKKLGTAHAVLKTEKLFPAKRGKFIVLPADAPLITGAVLKKLIAFDRKSKNDISILAAAVKDPFGYGRIIEKNGFVEGIREELDATPAEKKIKKINGGIYVFDAANIFAVLKRVPLNQLKKEYYLTDAVKIAGERGMKVRTLTIADGSFVTGVNSAKDLSRVEKMEEK